MSQRVSEYNNKLVLGEFLAHLNFNKEEKGDRNNTNKNKENKSKKQDLIKKERMEVKNSCINKKNTEVMKNLNTCSNTADYDSTVHITSGNICIKTEDFSKYTIPPCHLLVLGFPVEYELNRKETIIFCQPLLKNNINSKNHIHNRDYRSSRTHVVRPDYFTNNFTDNPHYETKWFIPEHNTINQNNITNITNCTARNTILEINCSRCKKSFLISSIDSEYITKENCVYHWGKLRRNFRNDKIVFTCCDNEKESKGCCKAEYHVWDGLIAGKYNGPFHDFVSTKPRPKMYNVNKNKHANTVLGLDCEMCYTMKGLEVCKIAIVNINGDLVYYTLVKPDNKIIDYNSRFSGVSEKDFTNKKYRSLKEVHEDLKNIVFCDTIVIGHGLENDLRVLKLIHKNIIDTSIIFPHFLGLPFRRSLRSLALSYLNKPIQFEVSGHDSREDAKSCIELMLWKIRNDLINDL